MTLRSSPDVSDNIPQSNSEAITPVVTAESNARMWQLARWMAGDFSNREQAMKNLQDFAHIHVLFRPLPFEFFNAIGFYSEQVYDYDLWSPYRQGVHRFADRGDSIWVDNFELNDPMLYAGASREADILATIVPEALTPRCGCAMVFRQQGERFIGEVEPGRKCRIPRKGRETYLVSEVEIGDGTWVSRDRGFDPDTDEQVWGSAKGRLYFEKVASFSDDLGTSRSV